MANPLPIGHRLNLGIRWMAFRGFADTGWLRLPAVTILLGSNGSGKSSLIAPLLLLKQSLASRTGSTALLTRGEYVNVGAFRDFVHDHDVGRAVNFSLRWHTHVDAPTDAVGVYAPGGVELEFIEGDSLDQVKLSCFRIEDIYGRRMLTRVLQDDGQYSLRMAPVPKCMRRPGGSRGRSEAVASQRTAMQRDSPVDYLFTSTRIRNAAFRPREEEDPPTFLAALEDDRTRVYVQMVDYVQREFDSITYSLYFLGPLREAPKRVYELSGEMPPDVGTRGEHAPEVLYRWSRAGAARLEEVQSWLSHFGFPQKVHFEAVGDEGFALRFGTRRRASTLADMGFGLSQVLPLIVQGLYAAPGSWLVVEQPEIHLNPRLQAGLADLVVALNERSVGLILETHSEHLLLRLRRLLAQGKIDNEDFGLYFVERDGNASTVREVAIDQSGYINPETWPADFFDDSLRESLALAQAQAGLRDASAGDSRN